MGSPDWNVSMVDIHLRKLLGVYCPAWTYRSEGKRPSRQTGGQSDPLTSGLLLGRSEVLKSLRHYMRAQSQGHHTIDRLEEGSVERGRARQSSLKGRERATANQTKSWNRFKGDVGETSERRGGALMGFCEGIDTILN